GDKRGEILRMAAAQLHALAVHCQLGDGKRADSLQHPEARTCGMAILDSLLHQTCPHQHRYVGEEIRLSNHSRRAVERPAPDEDREAAKKGLLVWTQQSVAPGDSRLERLLAGREVARTLVEGKRVLL